MALSIKDLLKIEEIFKKIFIKRLEKIESDIGGMHNQLNSVKDILVEHGSFLRSEIPITNRHIDEIHEVMGNHTHDIQKIKQYLHLKQE